MAGQGTVAQSGDIGSEVGRITAWCDGLLVHVDMSIFGHGHIPAGLPRQQWVQFSFWQGTPGPG